VTFVTFHGDCRDGTQGAGLISVVVDRLRWSNVIHGGLGGMGGDGAIVLQWGFVMARPLSEQARSKILNAAGHLLFDVGVFGFTVDAVAVRSGVAKSTIYRHFATSEQLMLQGLDSVVESFPTPNTGSLDGDLSAYCAIVSKVTCDPRVRVLMLEIVAAAAKSSELAKAKSALLAERMGPVVTMVQLAMARGEIDSAYDPTELAELVEAPFLAHIILHPGEPPTQQELDHMVAFAVAGLSAFRP